MSQTKLLKKYNKQNNIILCEMRLYGETKKRMNVSQNN